jgi:hypothetical protein
MQPVVPLCRDQRPWRAVRRQSNRGPGAGVTVEAIVTLTAAGPSGDFLPDAGGLEAAVLRGRRCRRHASTFVGAEISMRARAMAVP